MECVAEEVERARLEAQKHASLLLASHGAEREMADARHDVMLKQIDKLTEMVTAVMKMNAGVAPPPPSQPPPLEQSPESPASIEASSCTLARIEIAARASAAALRRSFSPWAQCRVR